MHILAGDFAATPSGYFNSILLTIVLAMGGVMWRSNIKRADDIAGNLKDYQEAQAKLHTETTSKIAEIQRDTATALQFSATTLSRVEERLNGHIQEADRVRKEYRDDLTEIERKVK